MAALEFYDGTKWNIVGGSGVASITAGANIIISGTAKDTIIALTESIIISQSISCLNINTVDGGTFGGLKGITIPKGTTAQRPTPAEGIIRINTDTQPTVNVSTVYIPSNIEMIGTGYLGLPFGPSSQRPLNPKDGYMRINTGTA